MGRLNDQLSNVAGRRCAICDKIGGGAFSVDLKRLREKGVKMKGSGDYAHLNCLLTAKQKAKTKLDS